MMDYIQRGRVWEYKPEALARRKRERLGRLAWDSSLYVAAGIVGFAVGWFAYWITT